MDEPGRLKAFVRDVLGCQCSEQVLANIRPSGASEIAGVPLELTLDVDGRLLVCVARPDADGAITQSLAAVFAAGKAKRDRDGFNRFRFVVAAREPDVAREALTAAFRALPDTDDRQHLHVVDVGDVPRMG